MHWSRALPESRFPVSLELLWWDRGRLGEILLGLPEVTHQLVHDVYGDREDDGAVVLSGDAVQSL